jgi:serine/threonine-protein kinase
LDDVAESPRKHAARYDVNVASGDQSLVPDVTRAELLPVPFGRYTLLDRLGSGGMADVFLALAAGPFDAKKLVVVKRPRETTSEYVGMFMDEARLAMRLNHPNVVQTYEVGMEHGEIFLAMEYLEGQPLHRVVAEMTRNGTQLTHVQAARIAADALAGLHYAHELADYDGTPLQIVHRDVSPHNIFVTYEGQIKVVDFGIAKATMNQVLTNVGSVKGKLAYMAPEHARSQQVDRRSDVFVMGLILWELVARRRLVTGATSAELLQTLLTMDFPPLSCEEADVHPILEAIAMRALQRDPADRYATALEMREALESYIGVAKEQVRASDLGRLVTGLFSSSREQMSTKIRSHIQSSASSKNRVAARDSASGGPAMATAVTSIVDMGADVSAAGGDTNGPAMVTPPLVVPRREGRTALAVLALALSILALAVVLLLTRRGATTDDQNKSAARGVDDPPVPVPVAVPLPVPPAPVVIAPPSASVVATAAPPEPRLMPSSAPPKPQAGGARLPASSRRATRPIDTSFPR